jgi:hypothetical protein
MSNPNNTHWRDRLSDKERRIVERLDKAIAKADATRANAVALLKPIRNRAVQRNLRSLKPVTFRAQAHTQEEAR